MMANTQENLRAGMHFITRDLAQAGEGIPPAGVSLPTTVAGAFEHQSSRYGDHISNRDIHYCLL